jgi:hypothetical protein
VDQQGRITAASNGSGGGGFTPNIAEATLSSMFTTNSTSYSDTGLGVSMAVQSSTNKIKVTLSISAQMTSWDGTLGILTLEKDGVDLDVSGLGFFQQGTPFVTPGSVTFYITPGDTSSHLYEVYGKIGFGGQAFNVSNYHNISRITLEEIKA